MLKRMGRHLYTGRRFYMLHHGQVYFFSIPAIVQLILFALFVSLAAWLAYSIPYYVRHQDALTTLHDRFILAQHEYEAQIAAMQEEHERLSVKLRLAQDHFDKVATDLQERHENLAAIMDVRDRMGEALNKRREEVRKAREALRAKEQEKAKTKKSSQMHKRVFPGPARGTAHLLSSRPIETAAVLAGGETWDGRLWFGEGFRKRNLRYILSDTGRPKTDRVVSKLYAIGLIQTAILDHLEEEIRQTMAFHEEALQIGAFMDVDLMIARLSRDGRDMQDEVALGGPYKPLRRDMRKLSEARLTPQKPLDDALETPLANRMKKLGNSLDRLTAMTDLLMNLPIAPPIDSHHITSGFGPRIDPFTKKWALHEGIDLVGTGDGVGVRAVLPGVVISAIKHSSYGMMIELDHGRGLTTRYGHLGKMFVKPGQEVAFRQSIGTVGNTGRSTAAHLHYEIRLDDKPLDPWKFLEAGRYVFKTRE